MDILVGDFVFQEILFPLKLTIDIVTIHFLGCIVLGTWVVSERVNGRSPVVFSQIQL